MLMADVETPSSSAISAFDPLPLYLRYFSPVVMFTPFP